MRAFRLSYVLLLLVFGLGSPMPTWALQTGSTDALQSRRYHHQPPAETSRDASEPEPISATPIDRPNATPSNNDDESSVSVNSRVKDKGARVRSRRRTQSLGRHLSDSQPIQRAITGGQSTPKRADSAAKPKASLANASQEVDQAAADAETGLAHDRVRLANFQKLDGLANRTNQPTTPTVNDPDLAKSDNAPGFIDPEAFRVRPQDRIAQLNTTSLEPANRPTSAAPPEPSSNHTFSQVSARRNFFSQEQSHSSETISLNFSDEIAPRAYADSPIPGNATPEIGYDPLYQAFSSSLVGDPYLASPTVAPDLRYDAIQKTKTWRSPNMKHSPLYFEDAPLERHGQGLAKLQPALSGVRFFSSVLLLPQKMLATPPDTCVYPIGHGRPGDCQPKVRETLPRRGQ